MTWGVEGSGKNKISTDKRVPVTEVKAVPNNGVIANSWKIVAGDPTGRYMLGVRVDDQLERVFVFDVQKPEKKHP
jgi:hypothetical protein